jgi:hypothetical protein
MATTEELQNQINSLSATIQSLFTQFDKQVLLGANEVVENQTKFVKSIAVLSGTIAPFSLFLLQTDARILDSVGIKYLFAGFSILMVNVLCIFTFLRWLLWIDYREKISFLKLISKAKNKQELFFDARKNDVNLTSKLTNDITQQLQIITELQSLLVLVFEQKGEKKKINLSLVVREVMIWVSLILLWVGVALIIKSFLAIF